VLFGGLESDSGNQWRRNGRNFAVQRLRFLQVQVGLDTFYVLRLFVAGLTMMSASHTVCCLMTGSRM